MDVQLRTFLSREVDCVLPASLESGSKFAFCGLGLVVIHDTARCLLKIYFNRRHKKRWYHQIATTVEKKLILGRIFGVFFSGGETAFGSEIAQNVQKPTLVKTRSERSMASPSSTSALSSTPTAPQEAPKCRTEVLFFPDSGIPCKDYYSSTTGCSKNEMCPFLHDETAYFRLLRILKSAKKSIDVCVFCLTCRDLGSTLISKSNDEGVRVRVVTDSEQLKVTGSQIGRLRREGVLVRHDSSSYLMHHKFAIIDEELLINGSFNWTRTAITGNHENLVISRDEGMVKPFIKQFAILWELFRPDKQKGFTQKPTRPAW